jgi:hypothetical protein
MKRAARPKFIKEPCRAALRINRDRWGRGLRLLTHHPILLVFQVLICGDQTLKSLSLGALDEFSVLEYLPLKLEGGSDLMCEQMLAQRYGCTLIEQ